MKAHGSFFFLFILQLGREVLDIAANATEVGITTEEIDRIVHEVLMFFNKYHKKFLNRHLNADIVITCILVFEF